MSLWMVPAAMAAVGGLGMLVAVLRTLEEVARLKGEMARVATLRPALAELRRDADALRSHARRLHRGD